MSLLRDRLFTSVALGHFAVDVLNGQLATLLAFLSGPLMLTNSTLGLVSTVYIVAAALVQPFLGVLADRWGARVPVAAGVLWMGALFTLALLIPGPAALVLLVLASLGSGSFHPAGAMQASVQGRNTLSGRETTAASVFFMFGQMGYFIGPIVAGPLLDRFGTVGLTPIALGLSLPVGLNAVLALRSTDRRRVPASTTHRPAPVRADYARPALIAIVALVLVTAFQSMAQSNMNTFLPKYLKDLGHPASLYGLLAALFMGGTAAGNVIGGALSDRYGKRIVVLVSLLLSSVPLYLIGQVGGSLGWLAALIPTAGVLVGAAFSVMVVLAQRAIPGGMALASGLAMGFNFSSGAVGTYLSGVLADQVGLPPVFTLTAALALVGGLLAPLLERTAPGEARIEQRGARSDQREARSDQREA